LIKILIVEDDDNILFLFQEIFKMMSDRFKVIALARTQREAILAYKEFGPDLVLMDVRLQEGNGIEAMREILRIDPYAKIVACSALQDFDLQDVCKDTGCLDFISKPFRIETLLTKLEDAYYMPI